MGRGCLDSCFSWTGNRCAALTVEEPVTSCKFYKTVKEAERGRLATLDTESKRYERGNKKYWLMDITDEFLAIYANDIKKLYDYRGIIQGVEAGDPEAIRKAKAILGGGE